MCKCFYAKAGHFQNGTHFGDKSSTDYRFGIIQLESRDEAVGVNEVLEDEGVCVSVCVEREGGRGRKGKDEVVK